MRTIPFRQVFDSVVRLHGRDPLEPVSSDMARAVVERINQRVRTICQTWRWPFWEITEERAFRQVWNSTHQYKRASNVDGLPDEVFYLGTGFVAGGEFGTNYGYYRVLAAAPSDPPVGTTPVNATYWEEIEPLDSFIAYEQGCRRSIGMVLGVYSRNPRVPTGANGGGMRFVPSERGVDVLRNSGDTVFLRYKMPVPKYTIVPHVVGKTYQRGNLVYDPTSEECFQSLDTNTALVSDTAFWRRVPFPEEWAPYVIQGAFADSLMEFDQGGNGDFPAKQALAAVADQRANDLYQVEVDSLAVQGQGLQWNFCPPVGCICDSVPLIGNGSVVTTLTEACDDELGWVYPSPATGGLGEEYHPEIIAIKTVDGTPSLEQLATSFRSTGSRVNITIEVGGIPEAQTWQLFIGTADPLDLAQQEPDDYNAGTNNRYWARV